MQLEIAHDRSQILRTHACRWRAFLLLPVLRFWGQFLLWLGFFMIPRVKGRENLKKAAELRSILVFNHVSYLDALIVGSL